MSNRTCEICFSKLKFEQFYLRNSLTEEQFSGLALLLLKFSLVKEIDQEFIIFKKKTSSEINIQFRNYFLFNITIV